MLNSSIPVNYSPFFDIEIFNETFGEKFQKSLKRGFDITASFFGLLTLAPLFLLVATLIKMEDGGPVFFAQTRVGKRGKRFKCYKFRSMVQGADKIKDTLKNDHSSSITFKSKKDPRITKLGRFIRKASIDELPQLLNVFKGDMSLVGPRPPLESEVALYGTRDMQRLAVEPGITCIWQVSGRGDIPFKQQVEMDIQYINNWSLLLDFKLLFLTFPAVLLQRGAY